MKLNEAFEHSGMTAEEMNRLFTEMVDAYEKTIQELKDKKEELNRNAEFQRSYDFYSGKYEGLEIAITLMTGKMPFKPPEYLQNSTGSDLHTYQGGRNDND